MALHPTMRLVGWVLLVCAGLVVVTDAALVDALQGDVASDEHPADLGAVKRTTEVLSGNEQNRN